MKVRFSRIAVSLVIFLLCLSTPAWLLANPEPAGFSIVINLPSRTLELYSGSSLVKVYPVAIGKPSTPSPTGEFYVRDKEVDPWWYPPRRGYAVPPGPDNPLGYRWIEFAPLYGIHGTNAPWAIGSAVSNGCIRMHEENVEELFELISYGTPVRVTYERVKVLVDAKGEASLGIYPDVYGWQDVSLAEVSSKLRDAGLDGYLSDEEILNYIYEEADRQISFAKLHTIKVNGKVLANRAVTFKGTLYIPFKPVASALGAFAVWDEASGLVRLDKRSAAGKFIGGQVCITAEDAITLFGGHQVWQPEENCLAIDVLGVFLNGRSLSLPVQSAGGVLAVPLIPLGEEIGLKAVRRADGDYWVQGRKAPVVMVGEVPYIQLTKIYEVFHAYVYWHQETRSIELTYPFRVKGGGD